MEYVYYTIAGALLILLAIFIIFRKKINFLIVAFSDKKRMQRNLYQHCKINNFLIINDLLFPIKEGKYHRIDSVIFGNKYIYIIKQIKNIGEVKINDEDSSWRIIYKRDLNVIDNPIEKNKRIISHLSNVVSGLSQTDFINIVAFSKTCTLSEKYQKDNQYVLLEQEVFKKILEIENKSTKSEISFETQEKYAEAFYLEGLKSEKEIKNLKEK